MIKTPQRDNGTSKLYEVSNWNNLRIVPLRVHWYMVKQTRFELHVSLQKKRLVT